MNPFRRSGQRRKPISRRTTRGIFGATNIPSPAMAAAPAKPMAAAVRRNWRLVVGRDGKRVRDLFESSMSNGTALPHTARTMCGITGTGTETRHGHYVMCVQKLNVAIRSILRLAEEFENGPPCKPLGMSKNRDPKMPLGLPKFTLLKTLRAEAPRVKL